MRRSPRADKARAAPTPGAGTEHAHDLLDDPENLLEEELDDELYYDDEPIEPELGRSDVTESDTSFLDDLDKQLSQVTSNVSGYTSPLMAKMAATRLSLPLLAELVPRIRAGEAAQHELDAHPRYGDARRAALARVIRDAANAREQLFAAALPLIRTIAHREWRRRQQWGSTVTLEDLTQDAIVGFLKGVSAFKPAAAKTSPTNYLGQWMLVEMRRAAESLDHDLSVGHDAGERFRRIRALRSRLAGELGREPTDAEIAAASRDPRYVVRPGMVGPAPADGETRAIKGITEAQVAEERNAKTRLGHLNRLDTTADSDDGPHTPGTVDAERTLAARQANTTDADMLGADPATMVADAAGAEAIVRVVAETLTRMQLPVEQHEIIARRYGIHPHTEETSAREIAKVMGLHRERVTRVLTAFTGEMTRPHGMFHAVLQDLGEAEVRILGLGWAWDALATAAASPGLPAAPTGPNPLTEPLTPNVRNADRADGSTRAEGFLAFFTCDYHDQVFTGLYQARKDVPKTRACPRCNGPSPLSRVVTGGTGK